MEKVILKKNDDYREYIERIKQVLMKKTITEKKAQNQDNKTLLGNCAFWFQKDPKTENYYLIFDKDTASWDLERLKMDLEYLEYNIYKSTIY